MLKATLTTAEFNPQPKMDTIKLSISCAGSLLSRGNRYIIYFNDMKLDPISKITGMDYIIAKKQGVLRITEFGSNVSFHKITKDIVLFPEYIQNTEDRIECVVTATTNWLGVLTFGMLAPLRRLTIEVKY